MPLYSGDLTQPPVSGTTNFAALQNQYGGGSTIPGMPAAGGGVALTAPQQDVVFGGVRGSDSYTGYSDPLIGYIKGAYNNEHGIEESVDKAMQRFDKLSFTKQREMMRLLLIGGYAGAIDLRDVDKAVKQASQPAVRDAYETLVGAASDIYMSTGRQVTVSDVLRSAVAYRLDSEGIDWNGNLNAFDGGLKPFLHGKRFGDGTEVPKPGTYTTTSRSTDILNPEDAKALTRGILQQELGRDPTQGEYEDFLSALNAAERAHPTTQRTTTKYVLDRNDNLRIADQNTVTHQGIGAEGLGQLAYEKAQSQPGWAEYQAIGSYFPALLAALGSTTGT